MKKRLKLFTTLRKDITLLFFICIITIICIDFWLIEVIEFFNCGYKIGLIVEKLCLSYISAFIFYFLVVHIKTQKEKANIHNYIRAKVYTVINCCVLSLKELSKASNVSLSEKYPTEEELNLIFKSINPNSKAPLMLSNKQGDFANWIEYFEYYRQRSKSATEKIFLKMPFLDTKLVNLLAKIDDCTHFYSIKTGVNIRFSNTDLASWQSSFLDYIKLIIELEIYADKKLKDEE